MGNKVVLDKDQLQSMVSQKKKISEMCEIFSTSREVIMRNLREYGIDFTECVRPNKLYKFNMDKAEMQRYLDMHMTYVEIAQKWEEQTGEHVPDYVVSAKGREYGLKSEGSRYYMRRDNPACRAEVRKKISDSVSSLWESGLYKDRVNGMSGKTEDAHPNFKPEGTYEAYVEKAKFYHPEAICMCCGKKLSWTPKDDSEAIEVHHVDHDHANYALTNLMPLCRSCHRDYHRDNQFFTTVTKSFSFDAAHYLPYHDGKCKFIHGHTYHMDVTVRDVIKLDTGMVIDFSKLKEAVSDNILDKFDHGFLNEFLPYSTCECMIFWIWRQLSKDVKGLYRIKLQETDGSYAELTIQDYMQSLPQFECSWHYSKGIDAYYISDDHMIDNGTSTYPAAEFLYAHNKDSEFWKEYDRLAESTAVQETEKNIATYSEV